MTEKQARQEILSQVAEYCRKFHGKKENFSEGQRIPKRDGL